MKKLRDISNVRHMLKMPRSKIRRCDDQKFLFGWVDAAASGTLVEQTVFTVRRVVGFSLFLPPTEAEAE
jgi:hypothetical protein